MKRLIVSLMTLAGLAGLSAAATPKNALGAIAVSPDGAMVVAAGDNQALYILDPASLEVKSRHHVGVNPQEMYFSKDGAVLALIDHEATIHFLSSADWSRKGTAASNEAVVWIAGADAFVTLARPVRNAAENTFTTPLSVIAVADGAKKFEAIVAGNIQSIAAKPDGSGFVAMTKQMKDETEPKETPPKELKGLEKLEFEQRHDAYAAEIVMLDASGAEVSRTKTWFSSSMGLTGAHDGQSASFLGYQNENVKVAADGSVTLFKLAPSYLYGIGVSPDGTKVAAGSLSDGTIYATGDASAFTYKLDKIDGWPEYFKGFAFAPDGSVYAGTTSYRLVHIGADGQVISVKPVF